MSCWLQCMCTSAHVLRYSSPTGSVVVTEVRRDEKRRPSTARAASRRHSVIGHERGHDIAARAHPTARETTRESPGDKILIFLSKVSTVVVSGAHSKYWQGDRDSHEPVPLEGPNASKRRRCFILIVLSFISLLA